MPDCRAFPPSELGLKSGMITRGEILMLGVSSGVTGGLVGGIMLGIGMAMVIEGIHLGWLLLFVGAPASGLIGWILARRLARQVPV